MGWIVGIVGIVGTIGIVWIVGRVGKVGAVKNTPMPQSHKWDVFVLFFTYTAKSVLSLLYLLPIYRVPAY